MTKANDLRVLAAAIAVALAASLMVLVKPAEATFPGTNGRIVYQGQDGSEFGDYEIFSINDAAGGTPTNVTDNARNDFEAAFSPTGEEIAYSSSEDGLGNDKELYIIPAAGGTPTQLTSDTALDLARDPAFSPDGARVAYLGVDNTDNDWEVFVTEPEGSGTPTQLTDIGVRPPGDPIHFSSEIELSWSPDSQKIAYMDDEVNDVEIFTVDVDGTGAPTNLTNNTTVDYAPDWSPDGTKIAYQGQGPVGNEVFTVNADGTGAPTNVTNNNVDDGIGPRWSPDGQKIAYIGDDNADVFTVDAAGGTPTKVADTTGALEYTLAWSPDGARIAYANYDGSDLEIFAAKSDGSGTPTQLTNNTTDDHDPDWGRLPGPSDTTEPTVSSVNPPDLKKNVSPRTNVTATFSEALQTSTVGTATFTLVRKGATTPVGATVSYDPATTKATLDPNGRLKAGMTYIARVRGGNSGVKDLAGNALSTDRMWRFTIRT
jgi:Tol biopolymer transport system component